MQRRPINLKSQNGADYYRPTDDGDNTEEEPRRIIVFMDPIHGLDVKRASDRDTPGNPHDIAVVSNGLEKHQNAIYDKLRQLELLGRNDGDVVKETRKALDGIEVIQRVEKAMRKQ